MHTPGYTRLTATAVKDGAYDAWTAAISDNQDRTGRAIRVFDRTTYLAFEEDSRPLPNVLMLGTTPVPNGPLLIRTDAGPDFSFANRITPGDDCRVRPTAGNKDGHVISVGNVLEVEIPADALTPGKTPSGPIRLLDTINHDDPTYRRSRTVLQHIREAGMQDGLGWIAELDDAAPPPTSPIPTVAETWTTILEQEHPRTADITPLTRLIGRGPGATPSGDDILSGILYTLTRTTRGTAKQRVQATAERLIHQHTSATTTMSLALLEQAANGRAPPPVERCLTTLLNTSSPETCHAAATAMADIGHHSGADALAGILTTLLHIASRLNPDHT